MRIAYLSGPCDALAVYAEWRNQSAQKYFGSNYMKQFLQLCEDIRARAYIITTLPGRRETNAFGPFVFANQPNPNQSGLAYHLAFVLWMLRISPQLIAFRPDVMVLTANCTHWFLFAWLRLLGVKIIPAFDVVVWPKFVPRKIVHRLLWQLNRWLILPSVKTIIVASDDVRRQVSKLLGSRAKEVNFLLQLPTYAPSQFSNFPIPPLADPFRVIFAGRIEISKGIYDLLSVAEILENDETGRFKFDVCGDGSKSENFQRAISSAGLDTVVIYHGYCSVERFTAILAKTFAWVVPTRSEFPAGFEMVCAESILAGRPLVCSPVCPALEYVEDAAVRVDPNDVAGYCDAIKQLANDAEFYQRKQSATHRLAVQFYDQNNSFIAKMKTALSI